MGWDGPVTYRQYLAWLEQELEPTLDQLYLAQVACEVRRVMGKAKLDDFLFKRGAAAAEVDSRSAWEAALGGR